MYDAYISLGDNCEAGLNFRRIGYEVSSFFRFTNCGYMPMIKLIECNFFGVYKKENLLPVVDNMVRDKATGIVHHSLLKSHEVDGIRQFKTNYDFDQVYLQEYSKICHLVHKWRALVNSDQRVLYIFKHSYETNRELAEKMLETLRSQSPTHRCDLLYLQLETRREPAWPVAGLFNRYMTEFAHYACVQNYDRAAWDRLFAEFPLADDAPMGKRCTNPSVFEP